MATAALLGLVMAAGAFGAGARPGARQELAESVEVREVLVDAVVTDRDGRPVTDLDAGAFRVLADGSPVELTHFAPPGRAGGGPPRADAGERGGRRGRGGRSARREGADPGQRVVVLLDDANTTPLLRQRVLSHLYLELEEMLEEGGEVMVARYDGARVDVVQPFGHRAKELLRTLEDLLVLPAHLVMRSRRDESALSELKSLAEWGIEQDGAASEDLCDALWQRATQTAEERMGEIRGATEALDLFVRSLAAFPGRKALFYVSDGLPLLAGAGVQHYVVDLCAGGGVTDRVQGATDLTGGPPGAFDPASARLDVSRYSTAEWWRRLAARAAAARVTFYAVESSGLEAPAASDVATSMRTSQAGATLRRRNSEDTLQAISSDTGGFALLDTQEFRPGIDRVLADAGAAYEMAFALESPADGAVHSLEVQVERPGLRVRHRTAYLDATPRQRTIDGLLAALHHGREENPLEVELAVRSTARPGAVSVRIGIPFEHLVAARDGETERRLVSVFLTGMAAGRMLPVGHETIPLDLAAGAEAGGSERYVYEVGGIELGGGDGVMAVAVRDELGGRVSYLRRRAGKAGR